MAEEKLWKTRLEVKRLTIGKRELGRGKVGIVYSGRIWFADQKSKKVAVKVFNPEMTEEFFDRPHIDEEIVRHYEEVIAKLRKEKLPVLKTGFVKHGGKFVQVQELYAKSTGSKITDPRRLDVLPQEYDLQIIRDPQTKERLLDTISGIINAGLIPHHDTIGIVKTKTGNRLIIHDLDFLAHTNYLNDNPELNNQGLEMVLNLWRKDFREAGIPHEEFIGGLKTRVKTKEGLAAIREMERPEHE